MKRIPTKSDADAEPAFTFKQVAEKLIEDLRQVANRDEVMSLALKTISEGLAEDATSDDPERLRKSLQNGAMVLQRLSGRCSDSSTKLAEGEAILDKCR